MIRKFIFLLGLALATLAMSGAAQAQFGGLGKKLLDKAKDEVENALSEEADEPEKEEAPDSGGQPEADKPAAKDQTSAAAAKKQSEPAAPAGGVFAVPKEELSWRVEAGPGEGAVTIAPVFFNPQRFAHFAPGEVVLELKRRGANGPFEGRIALADRAFMKAPGGARLMVDGEMHAEGRWDQYAMPIEFDAARLVEAMKAGEGFSVQLQSNGAAYEIRLPLAGFAPKLKRGLKPPSPNAYRAQSVTNQCVQRNGGFSYECFCLGEEYVKALDAAGKAQTAPPDLTAVEAACNAKIDANPLLSELSYQELLFGAEFREAAPGDMAGAAFVDGAVKTGRILTPGPAADAGLRSGEIIIKTGSASPASRLKGAKPVSLGREQPFEVYSPLTRKTRVIKIAPATPDADIRAETLPMFGAPAAGKKASAAEESLPPAAPAGDAAAGAKKAAKPEPQKSAYADPLGAQCAADAHLKSRLYDCGCIDAKAPQIREEISDKKFAEARERLIPRREHQLRLTEERLAAESDPQRIDQLKRGVERIKKDLEDLNKRPDPMSHGTDAVALYAYKIAECKIGDYFRESEKKNCLASASLLGVSDAETYCACSSSKAADLWLQSGDQQYRSTIGVQIVTQARQACRG